DRKDFSFTEIPTAKLNFLFPFKMTRALFRSVGLIYRLRPSCVIGFGSYHSFPILLAAIFCRVPVYLHEQNVVPGKVIKSLSRFAKWTAVNFQESRGYLQGNTKWVKAPLMQIAITEDPYAYFGFEKEKKTVLITGGSQGAAFLDQMAPLVVKKGFQIIHCANQKTDLEQLKVQYQEKGITAYVTHYEKKMHLAWKIADLAITRSGAGTIFEQIEAEVPGILIPYPFSAQNHQVVNAEFMEKVVKGSLTFTQEELTPEILGDAIDSLIEQKASKIAAIKDWKQKYTPTSFSDAVLECLL
ncbi:MAG: UDP-N-acetylglucosamine--N-acetylmuramyl-(pentapeptide) pyrophosphoryl-undecaprenol N-acetylglucosamine transferase, partial [Waddliaceae bacterium]